MDNIVFYGQFCGQIFVRVAQHGPNLSVQTTDKWSVYLRWTITTGPRLKEMGNRI